MSRKPTTVAAALAAYLQAAARAAQMAVNLEQTALRYASSQAAPFDLERISTRTTEHHLMAAALQAVSARHQVGRAESAFLAVAGVPAYDYLSAAPLGSTSHANPDAEEA